jgi:hypothetical protein
MLMVDVDNGSVAPGSIYENAAKFRIPERRERFILLMAMNRLPHCGCE